MKKPWVPTERQMTFIRMMETKQLREGMRQVGDALRNVRELELWKTGKWKSFDAYCLDVWNLKKSTAYALMKFAASHRSMKLMTEGDEKAVIELAEEAVEQLSTSQAVSRS